MGDLSQDGVLTVTDVMLLVNEIIGNGESATCPDGSLIGDMNNGKPSVIPVFPVCFFMLTFARFKIIAYDKHDN